MSPVGRNAPSTLLAARRGDPAARARVVEENMGLARRWAARYASTSGAEFEDLVQAAALGILRAVDTYRRGRGAKFSTWAAYWMHAEVVAVASPRLSCAAARRAWSNLSRARARLEAAGEAFDAEGVARELEVPVAAAAQAVAASRPKVRLDDASGSRVAAALASPSPTPEEAAVARESRLAERARLVSALWELPPLDRHVVVARLAGELTQREVAAALGLSHQKVAQVESRAVRKLRERLERGGAD